MNKHIQICVKPDIGIKELKKYGFKQKDNFIYWKPHFTCQAYEKQYYNDETDYMVYLAENGQIIIRPNGWSQIAEKIQTLLFDMFSDGIVEKRIVKTFWR